MRRAPPALQALAVLTCLLPFASARADEVSGLRSDKVFERRHRAEVTMDRGHATVVIRRTVENLGTRHDQVTFEIEVPESAVAVALRTLGTSDGRPIWFRGDLLEAEEAARRYQELTGIGGYYPKDPALLSWRSQGRLALQVFPVPPRETKTVEYTLELPTQYEHGRDVLRLPRAVTGQLIVRSAVSGGQVLIDGVAAPQNRLLSPAAPEGSWIDDALPGELYARAVVAPADPELVLPSRAPAGAMEGRLAAVRFGTNRVLNHYRFDAPPRLSVVPRGAWIVVVVDGSRSFDPEERRAGLAALAASLSHHADGRVAVLVFDRKVHRLFPGFRGVASATPDLVGLAFAGRNGSQVDDALSQADAILQAESPSTAHRRILLVSDLRTRMALRPGDLRLRSGAIVHVGVVGTGQPALAENEDEGAWSAAVERTGGIVWRATATADPAAADEMRRVYEEWARPTRLRQVRIFAPGADDGPLLDPQGELREGEAIDRLAIDRAALRWAKLEGKLWGKRVEHRLSPSADEARLWAALVFGSDLLDKLTEPEMMVLARRGRAVSPVTSYLAIEPGVRPSTEGLEERRARVPDVIAGSANVRGQPEPTRLDRQKFLEDELGRAARDCGRERRAATVVLETTVAEVVDVPAITVVGADAALSRCLEEAAWGLDLPPEFNQPWARWTVQLPPPARAAGKR
ncbi:MAG TPA: VWA domain-containing protein [Polyangia bacterium]|jgi:hypothetical protein